MTMHSSESSPFPSPFLHILKTNYVPGKDEIQNITTLLREPEQKLDALNNQISRLEETLTAPRTQRDSLQTHIDHHRALVSPFRRCPEDLLREIFVQCLDPIPIRSTKHAPLLFTTICRSWRQIALTTPRLWCSIKIFIPVYPFNDAVLEQKLFEEYCNFVLECVAGAKRWLSRSGSVPITLFLSIGLGNTRNPKLKELLRSVLESFILFRSRWKEVRISNGEPEFFVAFKSLEPSEFPQLESLDLTLDPSLPDSDNLWSLLYAPSLSKLHLSVPAGSYIQYSETEMLRVSASLFRWRQFSEISIHFLHSALEVLKIIVSVSQTVRKCAFKVLLPENIPDHYTAELDRPYIHLPLLEWLDLKFVKSLGGGSFTSVDEHTDIEAFMDVLICPLLEDLIIENSSDGWHIGVQEVRTIRGSPLTQFLQQSGCSLKSFKTNLPLSPGGFEECLQFMPTITSLTLHSRNCHDSLSDDHIHPLIPVNGPNFSFILCPSLQTLELTDLRAQSADTLMRLITMRLMLNDDGDTRRIKTIRFTFRENVEEEHRFRVNEFREQGLDIRWEFPFDWKTLLDPRDGQLGPYYPHSSERPMLSF